MSDKDTLRESILEAVSRVVARDGMSRTTVEAIAAEAGMSKGGVLHHFPNKKNMLMAMIDLYEIRFRERRGRILETLPDTPHRQLKATVMLMLADMDNHPEEVPNLASVLDDEEFCRRVGEMKQRTFREVIAGVPDPEKVALVMYTVDGIWMDIRFSPPVIPSTQRKTAIATLLGFIDSLDATT